VLHIVYAPRPGVIRVITVRTPSERDRRRYHRARG
jgi:uncharacterized DUF497 family protein